MHYTIKEIEFLLFLEGGKLRCFKVYVYVQPAFFTLANRGSVLRIYISHVENKTDVTQNSGFVHVKFYASG